MIDSDELLAIGYALVQTVRSQIKYSTNMRDKDQLFYGLEKTTIFKKTRQNKNKARNSISKSISLSTPTYITKAQKTLKYKSGYCGELSSASVYIGNLIKTSLNKTVYITRLTIYQEDNNHALVILHESKSFYEIPENKYLKFTKIEDFYIQEEFSLRNAVFVDPWIYNAIKVSESGKLIDLAVNFNVENFYYGKIKVNNQSRLSCLSNNYDYMLKEEYLIKKFTQFYEIQKQKLDNKRGSFAIGRKCSSVRRSLEYNIQKQKQKQLISLRNFFINLTAGSFQWYKNSSAFYKAKKFKHSDSKGECINRAINYLNDHIENYDYLEDHKLLEIFQCILRILPIVRSSNIAPRRLSLENISMTTSAKRIFNTRVTLDERQEFEEIEGLELDWIREARDEPNARGRYKALLGKIAEFTPPNDIDKILPNFYEGKGGYYALVRAAIDE